MPINVTRKATSTVSHPSTKPSPKAEAGRLAKALQNAEDPGHMSNAANDAMKFLMSPAAKSLSVSQARPLHVALGETLASLDAGAGWRAKPTNSGAKALIEQLNSDHPGEIGNGVKNTMAFLSGAGAKRLDSTSRNELFKALGDAQGALQQIESNP